LICNCIQFGSGVNEAQHGLLFVRIRVQNRLQQNLVAARRAADQTDLKKQTTIKLKQLKSSVRFTLGCEQRVILAPLRCTYLKRKQKKELTKQQLKTGFFTTTRAIFLAIERTPSFAATPASTARETPAPPDTCRTRMEKLRKGEEIKELCYKSVTAVDVA
jgi:hypothetical protein